MRIVVLASVLLTLATASVRAQEDGARSDWALWLVGEWEGVSEDPEGPVPMRQSFEYILNEQYLYTQVQFGEGDSAFRGFGIFQYIPEADSAFGHFFGMDGVTNHGWAKRFDDRMVWHLQRGNRTTTRIRERLGEDEFIVRNYSVRADGTRYETTERLRRQRTPAIQSSRD